MGLYLDIAKVYSKGSLRRLFLYNMITQKVRDYDTCCYSYIKLVTLIKRLWFTLLYEVMTTYVTSIMKQSLTYGLPSYLLGFVGVMGLHMTIAPVGWR